MNRYFILIVLLLLIAIPEGFAQTQQPVAVLPGNCLSFRPDGNHVVFSCQNNINVMLQVCSSGIVKVAYEEGVFSGNNPSFAVINETIDNINKLNISEQSGSIEIYTGELIIRVNKQPFRIQFYDKYQKLLNEDYQDRGFVKEGNRVMVFKTPRPDEQFFGLGEKSGSFNRRGKSYKMWNSDKPCYGVNEDPLYKSIPFFISSYDYGIFLDNTYKTEFKFESESNQYFSYEAGGGKMVYYFIHGPSPKQVISRYVQLTGKPIMPPAWALGFSQCRGMLTNEKLTRDIASEYRKRQIPCDIIYQDIGWTEHLQDFEWKKSNYQNPKLMLSDLKTQGFKVIVSQDPVISQSNKKQWREADSLGYFTTDIRTGKSYDMPWPWGGNCGVVDFTKPGVNDWWGKNQQKVIDDGVSGFWTDMGEPAWSNEESTDRLMMKHYLGMHDKIHNVYGLTWDKIVTEQFEKRNPNLRVFQMTRAGYSGLQRYTFGWSGDSGDGNNVLNGWDKLANQIPIAVSAGMGLIPFWACDISGYCGDIKDYEAFAELYVRWMQFGVFNPLSRAHHEGNNAVEPWLFGTEAEKICKQAIEMKYKLHPYLYTYARKTWDTGLPIMRALLLEYPDDPESLKMESEFMFGEELLVAPVVERDAVTKQVYFPEGEWIDFNDGKTVYKGKQWITYPAPLSVIPVFVKRGSIVPSMPVVQYLDEKISHPLIVDIFASTGTKVAAFELYEDDGETNDYKKDIFCKTIFRSVTKKEGYELRIGERLEQRYKPAGNRNYMIRVHLDRSPKSVLINDLKAKSGKSGKLEDSLNSDFTATEWYWDKTSQVCVVKVPDTGKAVVVNLIN
jgi:alpha-glucosidase